MALCPVGSGSLSWRTNILFTLASKKGGQVFISIYLSICNSAYCQSWQFVKIFRQNLGMFFCTAYLYSLLGTQSASFLMDSMIELCCWLSCDLYLKFLVMCSTWCCGVLCPYSWVFSESVFAMCRLHSNLSRLHPTMWFCQCLHNFHFLLNFEFFQFYIARFFQDGDY